MSPYLYAAFVVLTTLIVYKVALSGARKMSPRTRLWVTIGAAFLLGASVCHNVHLLLELIAT